MIVSISFLSLYKIGQCQLDTFRNLPANRKRYANVIFNVVCFQENTVSGTVFDYQADCEKCQPTVTPADSKHC